MGFIQIITITCLIAGVALIFNLAPDQIAKDVEQLISAQKTLKYQVELAKGKRNLSKFQKAVEEIKFSLKLTKRENEFAKICIASFFLFIIGMVLSMFLNNILVLPILSVVMGVIPYLYIRQVVADFNKRVKEELETALSIITSSYIRTEDIIFSIYENIENIKQPVKEIFKEFLGQTKFINCNMKIALETLRSKIDNGVFKEWCDSLIACQEDKTLKDTLQPIAEKLTDIRIVNAKLENLIMNPRKDFYSVLGVTLANIPLIYFLNKEWFAALTDTVIGKCMIAVTFATAFFSTIKMLKITKPIEFKK